MRERRPPPLSGYARAPPAAMRRPPVVRENAVAFPMGAGRLVGGQEDLRLRLPSSLRPGVKLAHVKLMASRVEPVHTHLAPAYPVRRSRGGTHPRAARDARDRTPHADEDPFFQALKRCCAETACCKRVFQSFQMFQSYVASVLYQCCKNTSGCCTCCNGVFKCTS